jgi:RNA polymerase sporulation-specific sigma factor
MLFEEQEGGSRQTPEATLYEQAQAGDAESLNTLMERHERLVHYAVYRQQLHGMPYEEAVQAGRHGLWRAILGYDYRSEVRFASYAYVAIMRYIWAGVKGERRRWRRVIPLGVLVVYYYRTVADAAWLREEQEIATSLRALVKRLPRRLREVVEKRYGLNGAAPQTLQVIGEHFGVSGERIRQLQSEALVWLRQPAHSQELRSLLARHTQAQYELADQLAQAWLRKRGGRHGRH